MHSALLPLARVTLGGLALVFFNACDKSAEAPAEAPPVAEAAPPASPPPTPSDLAPAPPAALRLDSADQRASYGLGYNFGSNIAGQPGINADFPALVAGLEDGLQQAALRLDSATLQAAFQEIQRRHEARAAEASASALTEANTFLRTNAERPGVQVTASGLQYEVLQASDDPDAARPSFDDSVEVHYHGTLANGTVFDSSIDRGEPVTFPVSAVIPGWTEALQLMSVGDRWKLYLPPAIAYGPRGAGTIPANAALVFEVELLKIAPPPEPAPAEPEAP